MADTGDRLRIVAIMLLCVCSSWARAGTGEDWLIARVNGLWTWESTGPEGRVHKNFLNQEVLHLEEDGQLTAVSALPFAAGVSAQCSESARRNPKNACSSAFLACKPAGGAGSVVWGFLVDGGKGAADARNAYSCTFNEDAVLEAAHAVGLVERIEPKKRIKETDPAAASGPAGDPIVHHSD